MFRVVVLKSQVHIPKARFFEAQQAIGGAIDQTSSLASELRDWGWNCQFDEAGNVCSLQLLPYKRVDFNPEEAKSLFEHLAPFVEEGSFIAIAVNDGTVATALSWAWVFKKTPKGRVTVREEELVVAPKSFGRNNGHG